MISPLINIIKQSIHKVAPNVVRDFNEINFIHNLEAKENFVLKSKENTEKLLVKELLRQKPNYSLLLSNNSMISRKDTSNIFYVKGLLGKTNLLKGLPHFGIEVSLIRDKAPYITILYNPILQDFFIAEQNNVSMQNNTKLHGMTTIHNENFQNYILVDNNTIKNNLAKIEYYLALGYHMVNVSCLSLDIAYIASGKYNAMYLSNTYNTLEIKPLLLLLKEANIPYEIEYSENQQEVHKLYIK